jgi:hypothetical protein
VGLNSSCSEYEGVLGFGKCNKEISLSPRAGYCCVVERLSAS